MILIGLAILVCLLVIGGCSARGSLRLLTLLVFVTLMLFAFVCFESKPVPASEVFAAARKGTTENSVVSALGEPVATYRDTDGSKTLFYPSDYFGMSGSVVKIGSDGAVIRTWTE